MFGFIGDIVEGELPTSNQITTLIYNGMTLDFKFWDSSAISLIDADVTNWEILE